MVTLRDIQRSISHAIKHCGPESDGQATLDDIDEYLVEHFENNTTSHNGAGSTPINVAAATVGSSEAAAVDRLSADLYHLCSTHILSQKMVNAVSMEPEARTVHSQYYLILRFVRQLLPILQPRRIFEDNWWTDVLKPVMQSTSYTERIRQEARAIVAESIIQDGSDTFARMIVDEYLAWSENYHKREDESIEMLDKAYEQDETTRLRLQHQALLDLVQDQWSKDLANVLLSFGAAETKRFFMLLNSYFLESRHRLHIVYLMSEFLLRKRTHLHEILETELFTSMLKSLMYDNSTTLIAMSVTNLIMLLPRICTSLPPYLPQLFYIFARALCWDQLRDVRQKQGIPSENDEHSSKPSRKAAEGWDCADYTFSKLSAPPSNPQTGPLFTSLYGLYPCNLLKFLHKPYSYFADNNFEIPEEFEEETFRLRTIAQVSRHMLNPSLVLMDAEKELTDLSRWMKMEPPDVIAQIMSLDLTNAASRVAFSTDKSQEHISHQDLLDESIWDDAVTRTKTNVAEPLNTHPVDDGESSPPPPEHHIHLVTSTSSSTGVQAKMPGKTIKNILDMHQALRSGSEVLIGEDVWDADLESFSSPSPSAATSPVTENPASLSIESALLGEPKVDPSGITDATGENAPSASLTSSTMSPETRLLIAALKREVLLLRNELNFELFMKQQHLQHMGRLHREHMVDSAVEAESQRTYNATRNLRAQLNQAATVLAKLKSESALTKQRHLKWENEQSEKLRNYREARRKWQADMEEAKQKLEEHETASAAQTAQLLEAQKRVFELESELRTNQPLLERATENEHRVMQLTNQMLLWEADTAHLEEQKRYIKGLLSQWRSMEELVDSLQMENHRLTAKISENEDEKEQLKSELLALDKSFHAELAAGPSHGDQEQPEKNSYKKQMHELRNIIQELKEQIEMLEFEKLEWHAQIERQVQDQV